MLIQDIILWMIAFGFLLVFSAIAINGLFITTRGETETLPDGSTGKINDMIFFPLLQLLRKERRKKRIYYTGEQLKRLSRMILKQMPLPNPDEITDDMLRYNGGKGVDACRIWNTTTIDYLDNNEIRFEAALSEDGKYCEVIFYKEYPVYYVPKFIRKPLLECIRCMASVWGTLIFWPVVLMVLPFHPAEVAVWILFCFSLSWLNTFFYNKTQ